MCPCTIFEYVKYFAVHLPHMRGQVLYCLIMNWVFAHGFAMPSNPWLCTIHVLEAVSGILTYDLLSIDTTIAIYADLLICNFTYVSIFTFDFKTCKYHNTKPVRLSRKAHQLPSGHLILIIDISGNYYYWNSFKYSVYTICEIWHKCIDVNKIMFSLELWKAIYIADIYF
jgi:hypothetical protein